MRLRDPSDIENKFFAIFPCTSPGFVFHHNGFRATEMLVNRAAIRDPEDQFFRRAPMAASARSIAIPLSTNLNLAFDAELLQTHTTWIGPGLYLLGPPCTGKKSPFICTFDGVTLWTMPPFYPWSFGESPPETDTTNLPPNAHFRGINTKTGNTTLIYDVAGNGNPIRIRETPIHCGTVGNQTMVRRFEIVPCDETLWLLVHAGMGKFAAAPDSWSVAIQRESDVVSINTSGFSPLRWQLVEKEVIVSPRKKVKLVVDGWRAGYGTMVRCLDLKNTTAESIRHDTFYYTLNRNPKIIPGSLFVEKVVSHSKKETLV